jgi:hypothetical protein
MSRGEDHRKARLPHLRLARQINAVHDAAKAHVGEDHGDLSPPIRSVASAASALSHSMVSTCSSSNSAVVKLLAEYR